MLSIKVNGAYIVIPMPLAEDFNTYPITNIVELYAWYNVYLARIGVGVQFDVPTFSGNEGDVRVRLSADVTNFEIENRDRLQSGQMSTFLVNSGLSQSTRIVNNTVSVDVPGIKSVYGKPYNEMQPIDTVVNLKDVASKTEFDDLMNGITVDPDTDFRPTRPTIPGENPAYLLRFNITEPTVMCVDPSVYPGIWQAGPTPNLENSNRVSPVVGIGGNSWSYIEFVSPGTYLVGITTYSGVIAGKQDAAKLVFLTPQTITNIVESWVSNPGNVVSPILATVPNTSKAFFLVDNPDELSTITLTLSSGPKFYASGEIFTEIEAAMAPNTVAYAYLLWSNQNAPLVYNNGASLPKRFVLGFTVQNMSSSVNLTITLS